MKPKSLITQQQVPDIMRTYAKELRREMTPAEGKLWEKLRAGRLNGLHFRRQQIVDHYIVDFYCHQVKLIVEVDGDVHFKQEDYDQERDSCLKAMGLCVLRFWNTDVNENMDEVLDAILRECEET
jgi:very-short-patch-repair endonuclease